MCRNRLYIGSKRRNAIEDLLLFPKEPFNEQFTISKCEENCRHYNLKEKNPFKEPFVQYKFPWMLSLHGTIYANKEPDSVGSVMLRILPDLLF